MIVCHCRNITCTDIHSAIDWMRQADPETLITPRKVYRALGLEPDCAGCLPLFLDTMRRNGNLAIKPAQARPFHLPSIKDDDPCKAIPRSSTTSTAPSAAN
ncbi:MAG: (2Fe-2S)-binding protein [Rhodobacteraceae bacterium]|nr:MAG: (2Fe-2S)-binding protein [Paracoccaceae bacterium]